MATAAPSPDEMRAVQAIRRRELEEKFRSMPDKAAYKDHLIHELYKWKSEDINIAVIGNQRNGKKTLMNQLMGGEVADTRKIGDNSYRVFAHPLNKNIKFHDLPPPNNTNLKKEVYFKEIRDEENKYKFFILLRRDNFSYTVQFLAEEVAKRKRVFYTVRTFADEAVSTEMRESQIQLKDAFQQVGAATENALTEQGVDLNVVKVFLINCKDIYSFDFQKFMITMCEDSINKWNLEALTIALQGGGVKNAEGDLFSVKEKLLYRRSVLVANLAAWQVYCPPKTGIATLNLEVVVQALLLYLECLGLSKRAVAHIEKLKKVTRLSLDTKIQRKLAADGRDLLLQLRDLAPNEIELPRIGDVGRYMIQEFQAFIVETMATRFKKINAVKTTNGESAIKLEDTADISPSKLTWIEDIMADFLVELVNVGRETVKK